MSTPIPDPTSRTSRGPKAPARIVDIIQALKDMIPPDMEFFVHESPANKYPFPPPKGWRALRSHKRRAFIKENPDHSLPPFEDLIPGVTITYHPLVDSPVVDVPASLVDYISGVHPTQDR